MKNSITVLRAYVNCRRAREQLLFSIKMLLRIESILYSLAVFYKKAALAPNNRFVNSLFSNTSSFKTASRWQSSIVINKQATYVNQAHDKIDHIERKSVTRLYTIHLSRSSILINDTICPSGANQRPLESYL
jgi:hypothetical protein